VLVYMIFWLVRSGFTLNLKGSSMLDKQKWVLLIILASLVPHAQGPFFCPLCVRSFTVAPD
jgi:hypothetical protein